jgi:hypothetical protein
MVYCSIWRDVVGHLAVGAEHSLLKPLNNLVAMDR